MPLRTAELGALVPRLFLGQAVQLVGARRLAVIGSALTVMPFAAIPLFDTVGGIALLLGLHGIGLGLIPGSTNLLVTSGTAPGQRALGFASISVFRSGSGDCPSHPGCTSRRGLRSTDSNRASHNRCLLLVGASRSPSTIEVDETVRFVLSIVYLFSLLARSRGIGERLVPERPASTSIPGRRAFG